MAKLLCVIKIIIEFKHLNRKMDKIPEIISIGMLFSKYSS